MDYHNEIKEKILLSLNGQISIKDLVYWVNKIYEQFFNSKEYELVNYRLINHILIELKDLEDDLENINSLNDEEHDYIIELLKKELCYLTGEKNYIETYKIKLNSAIIDSSIRQIIEDSMKFVLRQEELSANTIHYFKRSIISNPCLTLKDIILNEIINSILLINETNSSEESKILIGTLGKTVDYHIIKDEIKYLEKLYSSLDENRSIRFSLTINAERLLYTNMFFISN